MLERTLTLIPFRIAFKDGPAYVIRLPEVEWENSTEGLPVICENNVTKGSWPFAGFLPMLPGRGGTMHSDRISRRAFLERASAVAASTAALSSGFAGTAPPSARGSARRF